VALVAFEFTRARIRHVAVNDCSKLKVDHRGGHQEHIIHRTFCENVSAVARVLM